MDVRCEKCGTEYEFDEDRVGAHGVTVKCTACEHVFKVRLPGEDGAPMTTKTATAREWLVRKPDGQMIGFRELTTLQKWVVEGRISRDDEISKNGETWKRLGNIGELEPFFSVFEKARHLNMLIDQGSLTLEPLEIRGSELLSPHGPVIGISASRMLHPDSAGRVHPASNDIPLFRNLTADVENDVTSNPGAPETPGTGRPSSVPPIPSFIPPTSPPSAANAANSASAASLPSSEEPPTWVRRDPSLVDEPSRSDLVAVFSRRRRRSAAIWGGLLIAVAGLGGGAAVIVHSPEGSWLRQHLGWQSEGTSTLEQVVEREIELTRQETDLDTIESLDDGLRLLQEAQARHPESAAILAERALVLTRYAEVLRALAVDLEREAPGSGTARDPTLAQAKREEASALLREAFELARQAYKLSAFSVEAMRALAAYYQVQKDRAGYDREISKTKRLLDARGIVDPTVLYIEAAALFDAAQGDRAILGKATGLLEQAIGLRPGMNRARILLARVHASLNDLAAAQQELTLVLSRAPNHQEALRLRARSQASEPPTAPAPKAVPPKDSTAGAAERNVAETTDDDAHEASFEKWMSTGDRQRRGDRAKRAVRSYERARALRPTSPEPLAGLGWAYMDLERPALALESFRAALRIDRNFAEAYYGLAEAQRALGHASDAIEAYGAFLRIAPQSSDRHEVENRLQQLRKQGSEH
ncbi:MAG: zinc-ribbon domain-containing protein [Deltaproteobacteria bacterium]|nr:zinc-ribbon domain-containing protein [Deltaproteobacteria bacterium]